VQQALSTLASAQSNLYNVENPTTQDNLIAARDAITEAQDSLVTLQLGSDAATIDAAKQAVQQAQIALGQAQLALQQAQVIAPFDGVITGVNITLGQDTSTISGGAIQMATLGDLQITVDLAEVDVDQIQVGQDVQVSLDALPDATVDGKVALVYPAGTLTSGVVDYPVTINLVNPPAGVMAGMTANVDIVIQEKDNVLMVPNRAVKTFASTSSQGTSVAQASATSPAAQGGSSGAQRASGGTPGAARRTNGTPTPSQSSGTGSPASRQYVIVLEAGQQVQVPVVTGISNDTMTEIVSGLQEGDTVVVNGATTTSTSGGGGMRIPGLGRF
jgi:HlyD family secretion protein